MRAEAPTFVVDGGDLLWSAFGLPDTRETEATIKADLIADVYGKVGIDALVPGKYDLALGLDRLKAYGEKSQLPWLAANLECGGKKPFPGGKVVERDGWRVGFVGAVADDATLPGCTVTSGMDAIATAAAGLGTVDVLVALGPFNNQNAEQVLAALPTVDFIISSGEAALVNPKEIGAGHWLLGSGSRGKKLGVMKGTRIPDGKGWRNSNPGGEIADRLDSLNRRIEAAQRRVEKAEADDKVRAQEQLEKLQKEAEQSRTQLNEALRAETQFMNTFSNELLDLGTDVADDETTRALVDAAKAKLEAAGIPTDNAKRPLPEVDPALNVEGGPPFVGSAICRSCHEAEYRQWRETPHGTAYSTLVKQKKQRDPACYTCHVTGAFHPDGPRDPKDIGPLANVGCESCHGPLRAHAQSPQTLKPSSVVGSNICLDCHTKPGDPGKWDEATYMEKVKHNAMIAIRKDTP